MSVESTNELASGGKGSGQSAAQALRRRKSRALAKLIFFVLSLVLGVAMIEGLLWLLAPVPFAEFVQYEHDGHIRVRPLPNQVVKNGDGYGVRINRDGFRGPDYSYEKPKGTLRIQVYGGSAAFDFAASSEEKSWPGAIQKKLEEALKMPVEVMNLGVPGFDAFNSKINYLYTGRNYHPDVVILYETWNTMSRYRELEMGPYRVGPSTPNKPIWERVARATQLGRRLHPIVRRLQGRMYDDVARTDASKAADLDRPADAKAIAWDRQNFIDFVNFAQSDGVLPILVSMAFLGSPESLKDPEIARTIAQGCVQRGFNAQRATETVQKMSGIIEEVASTKGAVLVDGYSAVPHDLKHIRDNVHLRDGGSEKLAQAIVDVLLKDPKFLKVVDLVRAESAAGAN